MNATWKVIGITAIFGAGVALGYVAKESAHKSASAPEDAAAILKAITRLSSENIPTQAVACELTGQFESRANEVSVADFIASYLNWSLGQPEPSSRSLSCSGNDIRQCVWAFGEPKPAEGWGRILRFEYNSKTGTINPKSLSCLDVP